MCECQCPAFDIVPQWVPKSMMQPFGKTKWRLHRTSMYCLYNFWWISDYFKIKILKNTTKFYTWLWDHPHKQLYLDRTKYQKYILFIFFFAFHCGINIRATYAESLFSTHGIRLLLWFIRWQPSMNMGILRKQRSYTRCCELFLSPLCQAKTSPYFKACYGAQWD